MALTTLKMNYDFQPNKKQNFSRFIIKYITQKMNIGKCSKIRKIIMKD